MELLRLYFLNAWRANSTSFGLSSTSRISTRLSGIRATSEREVERRAVVHLGLGPHPATVSVHDALHDGQPDAGPLVVLGTMQALEDAEQLVRVPDVESYPVVLHEVHAFAVLLARTDVDRRQLARARE